MPSAATQARRAQEEALAEIEADSNPTDIAGAATKLMKKAMAAAKAERGLDPFEMIQLMQHGLMPQTPRAEVALIEALSGAGVERSEAALAAFLRRPSQPLEDLVRQYIAQNGPVVLQTPEDARNFVSGLAKMVLDAVQGTAPDAPFQAAQPGIDVVAEEMRIASYSGVAPSTAGNFRVAGPYVDPSVSADGSSPILQFASRKRIAVLAA